MIDICYSIGSNLADRAAHIARAIGLMEDRIGVVLRTSALYETSSWGFDSDPFLNAVVLLSTGLSPLDCFKESQMIEVELGRVREGVGYADRVIDLDILSYGHRVFDTAALTIPHPRIAGRRFVLEPWAEICPDFLLPGIGVSVNMLKEACSDKGLCEKWEYV